MSEPLEFLPIGFKAYPVRQAPADALFAFARVLAQAACGHALDDRVKVVYARLACAMIEATPVSEEYVASWMSPALAALIAEEWGRQLTAAAQCGQIGQA